MKVFCFRIGHLSVLMNLMWNLPFGCLFPFCFFFFLSFIFWHYFFMSARNNFVADSIGVSHDSVIRSIQPIWHAFDIVIYIQASAFSLSLWYGCHCVTRPAFKTPTQHALPYFPCVEDMWLRLKQKDLHCHKLLYYICISLYRNSL